VYHLRNNNIYTGTKEIKMIITYRGKRGCGKSLTMTKDAYRFHKAGWKVIHNFSLNFGEYMDTEEILKIDKKSAVSLKK
jgi:hypothetical protein